MITIGSFPKIEKDTIFQTNWETYRIVLRENYNQHATLYSKVPEYLESRFSNPFSILDLGCGDVDYFSRTLLKKNLWSRVSAYTGVDLSEQAIRIGEQNVRQAALPDTHVSFIVDDLLRFVKKSLPSTYDLVFSSIAIHHLHDSDKEQLVREIRRILKPNGTLMLIDIFLEEDDTRDHFVQEFSYHIRHDWIRLNNEQTKSLVNHVLNFDFPAKLSSYKQWASLHPPYADVKCLENVRFCKTVVFEI